MINSSIKYIRMAALAVLATIVMLLPCGALAGGNIEITGFTVDNEGQHRYRASLKINYRLSGDLQRALLHGVKLDSAVVFFLGEHKTWWFNSSEVISRITYQLKYHALSKQYVLTRNDTGEHWNFRALPAALQQMGVIQNQRLPELPGKIDDGNHYLFVKASVNARSSLSLPLKIQSWFNDKYALESEGILWSLP